MYKRYYDGYVTNPGSEGFGQIIIPKESKAENNIPSQKNHNQDQVVTEVQDTSTSAHSVSGSQQKHSGKGFTQSINLDDIILIGVILLMLKDNPDDSLLIIILAAIFLIGLFENQNDGTYKNGTVF